MRDVIDEKADTSIHQCIKALPAVANFTSKITEQAFIGNVFLNPDWRLYSFHITSEQYIKGLSFHRDKQQTLEAFISDEIANISALTKPAQQSQRNDLPLLMLQNIDWQPVAEHDIEDLTKPFEYHLRENNVQPVQFFTTRLAFYPNTSLISFKIINETKEYWRYFLEVIPTNIQTQYPINDKSHFYTLNGLSAPIHDCNAIVPLSIDEDNVLDYMSFFCFFVQAEEGSFYLIQQQNDKALPTLLWKDCYIHNNAPLKLRTQFKPPKILRKTEDGFVCEATMYYGTNISVVTMDVSHNGKVVLKKTKKICEGLPYRMQITL